MGGIPLDEQSDGGGCWGVHLQLCARRGRPVADGDQPRGEHREPLGGTTDEARHPDAGPPEVDPGCPGPGGVDGVDVLHVVRCQREHATRRNVSEYPTRRVLPLLEVGRL